MTNSTLITSYNVVGNSLSSNVSPNNLLAKHKMNVSSAKQITPPIKKLSPNMASSPVMIQAVKIRDLLMNNVDSDYNVVNKTIVMQVIGQLEVLPLTKEVLEVTRLGKHINELRRREVSKNVDLSNRAKGLVKKWRQFLVPQSNGPSKSSGGPLSAQQPQHLLSSSNHSSRNSSPASVAALTHHLTNSNSSSPILNNNHTNKSCPNVLENSGGRLSPYMLKNGGVGALKRKNISPIVAQNDKPSNHHEGGSNNSTDKKANNMAVLDLTFANRFGKHTQNSISSTQHSFPESKGPSSVGGNMEKSFKNSVLPPTTLTPPEDDVGVGNAKTASAATPPTAKKARRPKKAKENEFSNCDILEKQIRVVEQASRLAAMRQQQEVPNGPSGFISSPKNNSNMASGHRSNSMMRTTQEIVRDLSLKSKHQDVLLSSSMAAKISPVSPQVNKNGRVRDDKPTSTLENSCRKVSSSPIVKAEISPNSLKMSFTTKKPSVNGTTIHQKTAESNGMEASRPQSSENNFVDLTLESRTSTPNALISSSTSSEYKNLTAREQKEMEVLNSLPQINRDHILKQFNCDMFFNSKITNNRKHSSMQSIKAEEDDGFQMEGLLPPLKLDQNPLIRQNEPVISCRPDQVLNGAVHSSKEEDLNLIASRNITASFHRTSSINVDSLLTGESLECVNGNFDDILSSKFCEWDEVVCRKRKKKDQLEQQSLTPSVGYGKSSDDVLTSTKGEKDNDSDENLFYILPYTIIE